MNYFYTAEKSKENTNELNSGKLFYEIFNFLRKKFAIK